MAKTKSFKDLIVWQKAYKLVLEIYKITKDFPREERAARREVQGCYREAKEV